MRVLTALLILLLKLNRKLTSMVTQATLDKMTADAAALADASAKAVAAIQQYQQTIGTLSQQLADAQSAGAAADTAIAAASTSVEASTQLLKDNTPA